MMQKQQKTFKAETPNVSPNEKRKEKKKNKTKNKKNLLILQTKMISC